MTDKLRYNLDENGLVTEIGFMENYEIEVDKNCPLNFGNWKQYKYIPGAWNEAKQANDPGTWEKLPDEEINNRINGTD